MILIHKVNQYFGKQVPISASSHMVVVETMNFPNRNQVVQLKQDQTGLDRSARSTLDFGANTVERYT